MIIFLKKLNFLELYEILLYKIDIFICTCIMVVPSIFLAHLVLPYIATKMISTVCGISYFLKRYIYWRKSYTHENVLVAGKCCI